MARGSTTLCKLIQRNLKQNAIKRKWRKIKDRPRKGNGLAPKSNPEWYQKTDSILDDINTDLSEIVSTSLDTSYSQEGIQNDNENESFEDNADGYSDKTFTIIPKMIMSLIMQVKKIR